MNNLDIIITGLQPWHSNIGGNSKNIAEEFSKTNRVIFINPPLDRKTKYLNNETKENNGLIKLKNNLWVYSPPTILESVNWMPRILFRFFNRKNNLRFSKDIKKALELLNFESFIMLVDSDMFRSKHLASLLKPKLFIYYTRDNLMTVPYWKKHGGKMEPEIMNTSDFVIANSPYLSGLSKKHNENSFYVGQGCDLTHFKHKNITEPNDLAKIKGLKIGYVGLLTSRRLNIELIEGLAKLKPEWQIVLIGPQEDCFKKSNLHEINNIHFLGSKDMSLLPSYIQFFDICINPQIINELTIGNYPRKIDEYLAMGKPTVATETPTMEIFKDHVYLGKTSLNYVNCIELALKENSDEKIKNRIQFAKSHTWENNVTEIKKHITIFYDRNNN